VRQRMFASSTDATSRKGTANDSRVHCALRLAFFPALRSRPGSHKRAAQEGRRGEEKPQERERHHLHSSIPPTVSSVPSALPCRSSLLLRLLPQLLLPVAEEAPAGYKKGATANRQNATRQAQQSDREGEVDAY
jgi:hypothetical protein